MAANAPEAGGDKSIILVQESSCEADDADFELATLRPGDTVYFRGELAKGPEFIDADTMELQVAEHQCIEIVNHENEFTASADFFGEGDDYEGYFIAPKQTLRIEDTRSYYLVGTMGWNFPACGSGPTYFIEIRWCLNT